MSTDPNAKKDDVSEQKNSSSEKNKVPKPKGLTLLALNAFLVLVAVLIFQVLFRLVDNSISTYGFYFTGRNIFILVLYALLFAFMYGKFSAIWSHDGKRARISLFDYDALKQRPFIERFIDTLMYTLFTAAIIWCGIEMIDASGIRDVDGDGVSDSAEFWFVVILVVSGVAQESGGQEESASDGGDEGSDDIKDPGAPEPAPPPKGK